MSYSKVYLMGNLTRDPEVAYTQSGTAYAHLGVAVNEKYESGGKENKRTHFVDVTVWGKGAEACGQLAKGTAVFIEGSLDYQTWEKNGSKHSALKVKAFRVMRAYLDDGKASGGGQRASEEPAGDGGGDEVPF